MTEDVGGHAESSRHDDVSPALRRGLSTEVAAVVRAGAGTDPAWGQGVRWGSRVVQGDRDATGVEDNDDGDPWADGGDVRCRREVTDGVDGRGF